MNKNIVFKGYTKELIDYVLNEQFLDENLYKLFVNQYRLHPDIENGWRGEFWGKLVRSACYFYKTNKSKQLYNVLKGTVLDMMTTQEKNGRVSSYPLEKEFNGWDMWGRKYVMLGMIYFYDICESTSFKKKVVKFLEKHANYIIKHVGDGRGKKSIFETSNLYGTLNSCSILSPFVRLYKITNNEKYLNFAKYIVDKGCASTFNILEAALDENLMPFEFKEKKAYELMSCYNGLLDYYEITHEKIYLEAVIKFADKLLKSDYTVIGCSGTDTEFLDNSSIKQTKDNESFSQETCVTVTLMDLCNHLYDLTLDTKYIEVIERSSLNAYFGAINNEHQTMKNSRGCVWVGDNYYCPEHKPFPFDSYSPLNDYSRGYQVAGFMLMQNNDSYGCCAAIGGFGLGLYSDSLVKINDNSVYLNMFETYKVKTDLAIISMNANVHNGKKAVIKIKANDNKFNLKIRVPNWMDKVKLSLNNENINFEVNNGYLEINRNWSNDKLVLSFKRKIEFINLNDMVSIQYGPIVLTSDERLNKDNKVQFSGKIKKSTFKICENNVFKSNLCVNYKTDNSNYYFVDYSQAGKNFDSKNSKVRVWYSLEK